jgi:hypothetical protein
LPFYIKADGNLKSGPNGPLSWLVKEYSEDDLLEQEIDDQII